MFQIGSWTLEGKESLIFKDGSKKRSVCASIPYDNAIPPNSDDDPAMNMNSLPLNMDYFYTLNQSTCQPVNSPEDIKKVKSIPLYPHEYPILFIHEIS